MIRTFFIKFKFQFLILIIGYIWLEILNFVLQLDIQNIIYPDSESYFEAAENLYIYQRGHNYRPIFLALIHGIPFIFGASHYTIYQLCVPINFLCLVGTSILIYQIAIYFISTRRSFLVALLPYLFFGNLISVYHLLSENIYLFFIVLAFYFLLKYYITNQFYFLSISISIFTISMLIRPGSKLLAIFFMLYFAKKLFQNFKTKAMVFLYFAWFLVFVQCTGLKYQFGNFTISYIDSVTYHNYLGSKAQCIKAGKEFIQFNNPRGNYIFSFGNDGQKIAQIATNDLINQIKTNKKYLALAYLSNIYDNTTAGNSMLVDLININNTNYFDNIRNTIFVITKWQNRIVTISGFFLCIFIIFKNYKKNPFFAILSFYVLYTIILSGISCSQGDRFHLIVFPIITLLFGITFYQKTISFSAPLQK